MSATPEAVAKARKLWHAADLSVPLIAEALDAERRAVWEEAATICDGVVDAEGKRGGVDTGAMWRSTAAAALAVAFRARAAEKVTP